MYWPRLLVVRCSGLVRVDGHKFLTGRRAESWSRRHIPRHSAFAERSDVTYGTRESFRVLAAMAARGCLPPGANVFVVAPTPVFRSPIVILMVTTMALVWTVNSTL